MKQNIHPEYYPNATVRCACGNTFVVGSTQETIEIEVCSACHPFYTGQDKMVDKVGQVQKFRKRMAAKESKALERKTAKPGKVTPQAKSKKPLRQPQDKKVSPDPKKKKAS